MHIAGNDGDDDNDFDLDAGFTAEAAPPQQTDAKAKPDPEPVEKPQQTQGKKPEAEKPKDEPKPAAEPKYRRITEEEWNNLSASAGKTASLEKQLSTVLGTVGNIKQLVTKLQTETPKGVQIALPKGALKKLKAEFPEMADMLEEDLSEVFKGMKGTGGDEPKPSQAFDEEDFNRRLKASRQRDAEEALEDEFPKWREIVGVVDAEGKHDAKQPFRSWLAKQRAEYQEQINSTDNAYLIARAIRRFRKETAKPAPSSEKPKPGAEKPSPKQEARKTRISAAVPLKGAGGPTPPRNSAEDEFEAGFRDG